MPTSFQRVLLGTTSPAIPVTPLMVVNAGPLAQGGTVLIEFSLDGRTRWGPVLSTVNTMGQLFRSPVFGYVRVTAGVAAAGVHISDITGANGPQATQMGVLTAPVTCANATTEQVLFGMRFPAGYLPALFRLEFKLEVSMTNNANVKTLRARWGLPGAGLAGTVLFLSPSLASALNYNMSAVISGRADGRSLIGAGPGASGGIGISTTAYTTADLDYMNQETELVVTMQKATGTDAAILESAIMKLF